MSIARYLFARRRTRMKTQAMKIYFHSPEGISHRGKMHLK